MFNIYFADGQVINQRQCEWKNLPNVSIARVDYKLPNGKIVRMEGFERYIHIQEKAMFILNKADKCVLSINLLGKHGDEVYQFSYHMKCGMGGQIKNVWGKEYAPMTIVNQKIVKFGIARSTNHGLWREGVKLNRGIVKIV